jgi:hypothetical protein
MQNERTKNISARSDVIETLNALAAIQSFYPNMHRLFEIFAVIPVTTATAERSFSTLKRIKISPRNSVDDERLSNLALIHIHHDIATCLNVEEIINAFCKDKRRIKFMCK